MDAALRHDSNELMPGDGPDRRRFPRVPVDLEVRYLRADGSEQAGRVVDVSACGLYIAGDPASTKPEPHERIVAYVDKLGRFEGHVARVNPDGFGVELEMTPAKQQRLAAALERVAAGDADAIAEARRHPRVEGGDKPTKLRLPNGTETPCRVIDISVSGASVETHLRPTIGVYVEIGRMRGRVVRHHETGFALEFADLSELPRAMLDQFQGE